MVFNKRSSAAMYCRCFVNGKEIHAHCYLGNSKKNLSHLHKHTVVFCICVCVRTDGGWGRSRSCGKIGISAFSFWSNFSWLNHPFYDLTGAVLDVQWTSCSPWNIHTVPHLGKSRPVFGALFFIPAVVWNQAKRFLSLERNTLREYANINLRVYMLIIH